MAGKRPDQHNITPEEGGATDYKNLPQVGKGHSSLDDTVRGDRHKLEQGTGAGGGPGQHFFDPEHPQPSKHANAGQPVEAEDDERQRELKGTEDPRDRGVGA